MSYFGTTKPTVYLKSNNDPANLNTSFVLPYPSSMEPGFEPVRRQIQTQTGRIVTNHLGYRFSITYTWQNISESDYNNIVKILNWSDGPLVLVPHADQNIIGYEVVIDDVSPSYPKNRVVGVDVVTLTFTAVEPKRILDYDNMLNVQIGWADTSDVTQLTFNEYYNA